MTLYCCGAGMLVGEWALWWDAVEGPSWLGKAPLGLVQWRPPLWMSLAANAALWGTLAVLGCAIVLHVAAFVRMLALPSIRWLKYGVRGLEVRSTAPGM